MDVLSRLLAFTRLVNAGHALAYSIDVAHNVLVFQILQDIPCGSIYELTGRFLMDASSHPLTLQQLFVSYHDPTYVQS